jgi:hypothetical protein
VLCQRTDAGNQHRHQMNFQINESYVQLNANLTAAYHRCELLVAGKVLQQNKNSRLTTNKYQITSDVNTGQGI